MKLDDIRVSHKLWGAIMGLLVLSLGVALFTQYRSSAVMLDALEDVQRYESAITDATRWQGMTEVVMERTLAAINVNDPQAQQFLADRGAADSARINELQERIRKIVLSNEGKRALEKVEQARTSAQGVLQRVSEVKASGDSAAAFEFARREFMPASAALLGALTDFVKQEEALRDAAQKQAQEARQNAVWFVLGCAALVFAIAIALVRMLVRSITQPLYRVVAMVKAISAGDLTQTMDVQRKDEFGDLLKECSDMSGRLRALVSDVRSGVESVSLASSEIANGNQDLSARTEQTASNLEEAAASMEQLTATVGQSADTARQANQLAGTAAQAAARGGEVVGQVVASMQQITESSRKIADIISVIDGIAFQTNILALNAAVEAARAGEQGRGFAVVASEVRSLAGRSAEAAKEIKNLIGTSVANVESGSQQVAQAGESMTEIVTSVQRVSDLIGEITASSTEQRDGISQVNQAVTHLDQMTQQNAALVEESAAAASAMRDQMQHLSEVMAVFNVGAVAVAAPRAHAPRAGQVRPAPAPAAAKKVAAPERSTAARPAVAAPERAPIKPAVAGPAPARAKPASAPVRSIAAAPAPRAQAGGDDDWESF